MLKKFAAALAIVLLGASWGLAQDKISIGGSTTVLPIAQKAVEVYMAKYPQVSISVSGSGSGDGIKALTEGSIDIAGSSRGLKDKEVAVAKERGVTLVSHVVAIDCIVPIVNPENPITSLTLAQLKSIYNGQIKNWKEVGGLDKPIVVISRDFSSGTFETWQEKVLGSDRVRVDAQMQNSNGGVAGSVAGNKYAIGYVGIGYVNTKVKGVNVDGVRATVASAKDKSYPLSRELYMFTNGEAKGAVKNFLEFVMGRQGQSLVEAEGFVAAY